MTVLFLCRDISFLFSLLENECGNDCEEERQDADGEEHRPQAEAVRQITEGNRNRGESDSRRHAPEREDRRAFMCYGQLISTVAEDGKDEPPDQLA